jgi:hypothetical protein
VKADIEKNTCEVVISHNWRDFGTGDFRGGSQIIPYKDYYISLVHTTYLFKSPAGRKDGIYRHRFIVFNKDFNIVKITPEFSFLGADVEFSIGMTEYNNDILITFGFQDNAAYLLAVPKTFFEKFIY